uniref:Endoribonuclease n=1 Tax=Parascaris equorum TaxID=6256 RepID=A0A914S6Z8_PAREQ
MFCFTGLVSLDAQTFKNQLYEIWFEEYARDSVKGTSGFETIFVGEVNGTKVVGLNNWYRFYRLEMNNKTNYHGWFNRAKDVHITLQYEWGPFEAFKDAFLMGCSPEFEIAAYTICALSQFKECLFNHTTYQFSMNIETISPPGEMMKITSLAVAQYTGATTTKVTVSQKTTTKGAGDARLQKLVDDMRAADIDRPTHYPDVFQVCQEETPLTADIVHASLLNITFDSFTNTTVFQLALEYLQEIRKRTLNFS